MTITTLPSALNNVEKLRELLFQRVKNYVAIAPWNHPKDDYIDVSLPETTVACSLMSQPGKRGLTIYLDPERGNDGEPYYDARALILMLQPGEVPDSFHPCLVRSDRAWDPYPEASELRLTCEVLEALTQFLQMEHEEVVLALSSGREAEVCWGYITDYDPELEARTELEDMANRLWYQKNHEEGARQCALLVMFDPSFEWRQKLASHLYAMEMYDDLEELWMKFRADKSEEWLYIGALSALKRGQKRTFKSRLERAVKLDTYGYFLLEDDEEEGYSDQFLRRWRDSWREDTEASRALRETLAKFYPRLNLQ